MGIKPDEHDAMLGAGYEGVRLNVPKGKFRVVQVDMFDHTVDIIEDFDSKEAAIEYVEEAAEFLEDEKWLSYVVYDDKGEIVYDSDWKKEKPKKETLDKFMDFVHKEFGDDKFEAYIKTAEKLSEKGVKSIDNITETVLEIEGTVQDKLKNLFFIYGFLGLVSVELGVFINSTGNMVIEASGFKDPRKVYGHIEEMNELTDDLISLVSIAGLKFGYDFKHSN